MNISHKVASGLLLILLSVWSFISSAEVWVDLDSKLEVTQSKPVLDRVNRQYKVYLDVKNISAETFAGTLRVILNNPSVMPLEVDGEVSGQPYYLVDTELSLGSSIKVAIIFPLTRTALTFEPQIMLRIPDNTRVLKVDKFGDGVVSATSNGSAVKLECDNFGSCHVVLSQDQKVTITATPATKWQTEKIQGCTQVNENSCELVLSEDSLVSVAFSSSKAPVISDQVILLTEDQLKGIKDYDLNSDVLTFTSAVSTGEFLPGAILIAHGADYGYGDPRNVEVYFAKTIIARKDLADGNVQLTTVNASLEDIVKEGTFVGIHSPEPLAVIVKSLPSNMKMISQRLKSAKKSSSEDTSKLIYELEFIIYDEDSNEDTENDQAKVIIELEVEVQIEFSYNVTWQDGLTELRSIVRPIVNANFSLEQSQGIKFEAEKLIFEIPLKGFTFGLVYIKPDIDIKFNAKLSAAVQVKPTVNLLLDATAGGHWKKGHGWRTIKSFDLTPEFSVAETISVNVNAQFGVAVEFSLLLYGLSGPVITITPHVGANLFPVFEDGCLFDFVPYYGVDGNLGVEFEFLKKGWKKNFPLTVTYRKEFDAGGNMGCSISSVDIEPPSSPSNLSERDISNNSIEITWNESTDNVGVRNYKIYRNNKLWGSNVAGNVFIDSGLAENTEFCYFLLAVDAAGNESDISTVECFTTLDQDVTPPSVPTEFTVSAKSSSSITLEWNSSTDDNNVSGYLIFNESVIPKKLIGQTDKLKYEVTGLNSDTNYCFSVSATDENSNSSNTSVISCADTFDGSYGGGEFGDYKLYRANNERTLELVGKPTKSDQDVGMFTLTQSSNFGGSSSYASNMVIGDFLGDSEREIIVVKQNTLRIYDADLNTIRTVVLPANAYSIILADVDGDNEYEVVLGSYKTNQHRIMIVEKDGSVKSIRPRTGPSYQASGQSANVENYLGNGKLLVRYNAGYAKDNRGFAIIDLNSSSEDWYYDIGPIPRYFVTGNFDSDPELEFAASIFTPHNGASGNGTDDGNLYMISVDENGGKEYSHVFGNDTAGGANGSTELMFTQMTVSGSPVFLSSVEHSSSYRGQTEIRLVDPATGSTAKKANFFYSEQSSMIAIDIDDDGTKEVIALSRISDRGLIYDHNLNQIGSIPFGGTIFSVADLDADGVKEYVMADRAIRNKLRVVDTRNQNVELTLTTPTSEPITLAVPTDADKDGETEIYVLDKYSVYKVSR